MYSIGDRVKHNYRDGHGEGTIEEVRPQCPGKHDTRYFVGYCACRYPYVVKFDSGFREVYAEQDLAPVNDVVTT